MLTFETAHSGVLPAGWGGGPAGTLSVDGAVVHGGRWSARLERTAASPQAFSTLTKVIPVDFAGTTIEWRGFLRSENVSEFMGLWMRQDGDAPNLAFATMQPRQIRGTNDWTEYSITLPFTPRRSSFSSASCSPAPARSGQTTCGCWSTASPCGTRPGRAAEDADRARSRVRRRLRHRHQQADAGADRKPGDAGQGLGIPQVPPSGRDRRARVIGTTTCSACCPQYWRRAIATRAPLVLRDWIRRLGPLPSCDPCLTLRGENLHLGPGLAWIESDTAVGRELAGLLRAVHRGRARGAAILRVADAGCRQSAIRQRAGLPGLQVSRRRLPAAGAVPVLEHRRVLVSLSRSTGRRLGPRAGRVRAEGRAGGGQGRLPARDACS